MTVNIPLWALVPGIIILILFGMMVADIHRIYYGDDDE